jgi:hypothetical protein
MLNTVTIHQAGRHIVSVAKAEYKSTQQAFNRHSVSRKKDKTGFSIHLQDKTSHSSKKREQRQSYFRILTLENYQKTKS